MPTTYTPLATTTVSSPTGQIIFSSISQAYTDLVIVGSVLATSTSASVNMQFNSDGGSNYSYTVLDSDGSTLQANRQTNTTAIQVAAWSSNLGSSTIPSPFVININNYSNTATNKTALIRSTAYGASTSCVDLFTGLWRNTAAISTIAINCSNFAVGSTVSLYGIASAAVVSGAKATGGDVVATDGTYWYHAFRSSGTFTPTQALTADVLVVAGGGAGGNNVTPGGGAGGLVSLTSQSLSATNHTVTVGAGAAGGTLYTNGSNSQFGGMTAAIGGGAPGVWTNGNGVSGGSGGGGAGYTGTGGSGTAGQGNAGGTGASAGSGFGTSGGGGGAGAVGGNAVTTTPGAGGAGSSSFSSWGLVTGTGHNVGGTVWFAGGGTGGGYVSGGYAHYAGSNGGGGRGSTFDQALSPQNANGGNGLPSTGGGAGGGGSSGGPSGNGGSGIVIVRYAV